MFILATVFTHLLVSPFARVPLSAPPEVKVGVRSGVVFDGMLLCLNSDETVSAWDLKSEKYAKDAAARFTRKGLTHIAADGTKLWAVDEKTVYLWSSKKREWEKYSAFDADEEKLISLTPAQGRPFLVFRSKIIDPTREKNGTFKFPKDTDRLPRSRLNITITYGTDEMLWLATDNGEWGGSLIGFEPEYAKWTKGHAGDVSGITQGSGDDLILSWASSYRNQRTGIQVYRPDATERVSYPTLDRGCYYCIAYNSHDRTLYGMERADLVTIQDGKPTKIAKADFGVLSLIPLGPKSLAVISDDGAPYLLRDGKLVRLLAP